MTDRSVETSDDIDDWGQIEDETEYDIGDHLKLKGRVLRVDDYSQTYRQDSWAYLLVHDEDDEQYLIYGPTVEREAEPIEDDDCNDHSRDIKQAARELAEATGGDVETIRKEFEAVVDMAEGTTEISDDYGAGRSIEEFRNELFSGVEDEIAERREYLEQRKAELLIRKRQIDKALERLGEPCSECEDGVYAPMYSLDSDAPARLLECSECGAHPE